MTGTLNSSILITFVFLMSSAEAQDHSGKRSRLQTLKRLGAEGRFVMPDREQQIGIFRRFSKYDVNDDGELSRNEFVAEENDLERDVQERIFTSADLNNDDSLTHDEFSEHVVVMSEGHAIFSATDSDANGSISPTEFAACCQVDTTESATAGFLLFDGNKDDRLTKAEFLSCFCEWTRFEQPPVKARLIARKKIYPLPAEFQTDVFRKRITSATDIDQLPPVPKVNLVLVLTNESNQPVAVNPGGSIDEATVTVEGDGLVRPDSLQGAGGSSSATTPQPVIPPGETFRVRVRSLNPQENYIDNAYWTKPGEYRISASYPVYQNLPPHLPALFPDQPEPTGKPKRFIITASPITVQVVSDR